MSGRFELVKKGYDPNGVDNYIAGLEAQIAGYKSKDKAITNAIISAQQHADTIIANAKNQSRIIRENTAKQLSDIFDSINYQRKILADFEYEYGMVIQKYLKVVDHDDFRAVKLKVDHLETYLADFADEVTEDLEMDKRTPQDESDEELPIS